MESRYGKYEFREWELSEKAFRVYSNSSFVFYKYFNGDCYLCADNLNLHPYIVGTLKDVEEYLLEFAE